jgi:hypothetical protein
VKARKFPPQAKKLEGSTSAGWFEDEIDAYIEARRPDCISGRKLTKSGTMSPQDAAKVNSPCINRGELLRVTPANFQSRKSPVMGAESTLIATGMKINGAEVYCHKPSRKLLVEIGSISIESLARLEL